MKFYERAKGVVTRIEIKDHDQYFGLVTLKKTDPLKVVLKLKKITSDYEMKPDECYKYKTKINVFKAESRNKLKGSKSTTFYGIPPSYIMHLIQTTYSDIVITAEPVEVVRVEIRERGFGSRTMTFVDNTSLEVSQFISDLFTNLKIECAPIFKPNKVNIVIYQAKGHAKSDINTFTLYNIDKDKAYDEIKKAVEDNH